MKYQTDASQQRPQVVTMAVMGVFMLNNMLKTLFIFQNFFRYINCRMEKSKKAWSFCHSAEVNREREVKVDVFTLRWSNACSS